MRKELVTNSEPFGHNTQRLSGIASMPPLYLQYVVDLWSDAWRRKKASGDVIVIRDADDIVLGFQHGRVAQAFLHDLQPRMRAFELALHPDKTRLIRFRSPCGRATQKAGAGEAGDPGSCPGQALRLPWLHAFLHAITQVRVVRHRAQDDQETDAGKATGDQDGTAQATAPFHRGDRGMAPSDSLPRPFASKP